jgi:catechol 2,3-dioxygenase-like lactoylglutathione lyase family enzyme
VVALLVDGLGMRNTMNTPMEPFDGAVLGLSGPVEASAHFVYDARGPRTSPAVEVQQWGSPALTGEPVSDPTAIGMQALGVAVAEIDRAVAELTARGCTVVGSGTPAFVPGDGTTWATLADPKGVRIDLVADPELEAGASRIRHVRVNVADLERSLPWYDGLGFQLIDRRAIDDASVLGRAGAVDAEIARLRLPDEPFEALLIQWRDPAAHGAHPIEANHAGLYRAALGVDDTRAAHADLVEAGWTFDRAPIEVALNGTPVPDMVIAFLRDPDGVPFEFVQRPRSAFR